MLSTAEVRWFYQGDVPADVAAWFANGEEPVVHEPPRVDDYLLIPQTDELNVKFREGRIEIKQRHGLAESRSFAGGNRGTVEFWRKWSFGVDKKSLNGNLNETACAWLSVRKDRTVRTYGLQSCGTVMVLSGSEPTEPCCSLELTEVDAGGEHWWSLCLEAMGSPTLAAEVLVAVANRVLATSTDFHLTAETSCGYAAWLQRFA